MRRKLQNIAVAASLALCVAATALWVRSYWRRDSFGGNGRTSLWAVHSSRGSVAIEHSRLVEGPAHFETVGFRHGSDAPQPLRPTSLPRQDCTVHLRLPGISLTAGTLKIGFNTDPAIPVETAQELIFPYGLVVLLAAVLPCRWLLIRYRKARLAAGAKPCPRCGYDLRATPERCPECGTVREAAK